MSEQAAGLKTKQEVNYRNAEDKTAACQYCQHFQMGNTCELVDGPIDPTATCNLFMPVDKEAEAGSTDAGTNPIQDMLFGGGNGGGY